MKLQLTKNAKNSYKIGVDEIEGLKTEMYSVLKPVIDVLQNKIYWQDDLVFDSEYKSRDGFIAHSSNLGGPQIEVVIPKCEEHDFSFLEFGNWDGAHYCDLSDTDNCECSYDQDGEYDAKLRIWLKLENVNIETGEMSFYLYCGGGNGDAPYFRTKYENDIFAAEFTCKSVKGLKKAASKHIKALLKIID